jgi:hypothetical protein
MTTNGDICRRLLFGYPVCCSRVHQCRIGHGSRWWVVVLGAQHRWWGGSCWTLVVVRAVHGWGVIMVVSSRCMGVVEPSLLGG